MRWPGGGGGWEVETQARRELSILLEQERAKDSQRET